MKIKYLQLFIVSMVIAVAAHSQHQLYFENFEGTTNTFTLNDSARFQKGYGNNKWIVNDIYNGGVGVPKTLNEDSTFGGHISYAPTGHYMHIYDSASGILNDAYNPNDSSWRFAHMTTGICTKSLTDIYFNFYYLCQGSPTAYGLVYYSIDGGTWTPTGDTLNKRYKWQYKTITSASYTNVEDLRFGFLWQNNKIAGKDTSSLGIDDASMYGIYDSIAHPITCTFTNFPFAYPQDSCIGYNPYAYFSATLTDSTCNSVWYAYMSKPNGSFPGNGLGWYQTVGQYYYNDISQYWYLTLPLNFTTPGCYKFQLQRAEYPYLIFTDSICIPFVICPDTINTLQPPATLDTNPVCAGSVIDVPFWSKGNFTPTNIYIAILIDSIGRTAKIDTIGYLPSNTAYPSNAFPPAPGDVVSTIPLTASPGCKYYVQVICTTTNIKSFPWGPFCIQHCEIKTNEQQSVQACLEGCRKEPRGFNDTIVYNDSLAKYFKGNKFEVQLISFVLYPPSFGAINTGLLGVKVDTANGHFKLLLHVPCPDTLFMNGINPGVYYMRIVADSSNFPDSALGSLVQLTIGEPADSLYITFTTNPPGLNPPYCLGDQLIFTANPNDQGSPYNSTYQWWETDKKIGKYAFPAIYNQDMISLTVTAADTFVISCQETNYSCSGAVGVLNDTIIVLGPPSNAKTGPLTICVGDTGIYSIPFQQNTSYIWTIPAKAHADTSTNVLKIKFDSTGTYKIDLLATNSCFSTAVSWTVTVLAAPVPVISAFPSTTFCAGVVDTLKVTGASTYKWSTGSAKTSITVAPTKDTTYWVKASNKGCSINDTVMLTVLPRPVLLISPSTLVCLGDTTTLKASGAQTYNWLPTTGLVNNNDSIVKALVTTSQTYTVTGSGLDGCVDTASVSVNVLATSGSVSSAVTIPEGASVTLLAGGGTTYLWTPSTNVSCDTCAQIVADPEVTTTYTVKIKDADGCLINDTVTVEVIPICGIFVPNAFSPGNPNKQNIKLYVRSECLQSVDFMVFDRWGNKVFETKDLNVGWDGTFNNGGSPMNPGTFVYYVTGTTTSGKTLTKKGNVALIR